MNSALTIGKAAQLAGVNIQTLHYYERRGLLRPEGRLESGYRLYGDESVRRLRFIKNAQGLGFSLEEIARLLRLRVGRGVNCGKVRRQAQARLDGVRRKIMGLKAIEKTLQRLIRTCAAKGTTDACPILEAVDGAARPVKTGNHRC
jgi:MerR family mercuric resistance operon transcriptional regulator/MerR family gold-responsive transcriptional activator of gol and ges genes